MKRGAALLMVLGCAGLSACGLQPMYAGGGSAPPWDSFNLGSHVGDDPRTVAANRVRLRALIGAEPVWLEQVHGCAVADAGCAAGVPEADAAVARVAGRACAVHCARSKVPVPGMCARQLPARSRMT